jgi:hypothetical protein
VVAELRQSDYPGRWWTILADRRIECLVIRDFAS